MTSQSLASSVTVRTPKVPMTLNHSLSIGELDAIVGKPSVKFPDGATTETHGLTERAIGFINNSPPIHFQINNAPTIHDRNGVSFCVKDFNLDVTIAPESMTVYIAKEIKQGSCRYDVVYNHELTHVNATYEAIQIALNDINQLLHGTVNNINKICAPSKQELGNKVSGVLRAAFDIVADKINYYDNRLHSKIDTLGEYTRLSEICK